jgi:hypothetical protein
MGKIVIEYRYAANEKIPGRRNTSEMRHYLEDLVYEMRSAGIDTEYVDSVASKGDINCVRINGRDIMSILDGLEIKMLEADDCDPKMRPKMVIFERPVMDWDRNYVEDIPDTMMKNAVSKAYADSNKNGTI